MSPEIVRRVLRRAGIAPGAIRQAKPNANPDCLADRAWLAAEYATKGAQQIAKELGCRRDAVYEALHAAGIALRANGHGPAHQEIPAETTERVVSLYQAGWTAKRIASDLGLQVKRVNDLVEQRGVKRTRSEVASLANAARRKPAAGKAAPKPATAWPPEVEAEVLERYTAGESGVTIAESLGLAPSSVYQVLEECGVAHARERAADG